MEELKLGLVIDVATAGANAALGSLGQSVARLRQHTARAVSGQERLGRVIERYSSRGIGDISRMRREYDLLGKSIDRVRHATGRLEAANEKAASHRAAMGEMWGSAVATAGLGMALAAPVKSAMDFESAMADVKKVVDGTDEELAGLGDNILAMSRTLPLSASEIAAISAAGGQLGVALKDIPAFTGTVAKAAVAFDMPAEAAGDAMAKLSNVFQIPVEKIGSLGDVINQLSNQSAAKASDIVTALSRVGGVARQFGLGAGQAAALTSAMIALGKPPEVAGTAINGMLTRLSTADKQGVKFRKALARMGLSASGLKESIGRDAQGALAGFLARLGEIGEQDRTGVLVDLFGLEYADDIAVLAGSIDTYDKALTALDGRAKGSMQAEFAARAATTANNLRLLKNNVSELGINIGSVLLPALNETFSAIRPLVLGLADWAKAHPGLVSGLGKLAAGLLGFKVASLGARAGWHLLGSGLWGAVGRFWSLRGAIASVGMSLRMRSIAPFIGELGKLGGGGQRLAGILQGPLKSALFTVGRTIVMVGRMALTTPIGLAIGAAALLIYKYWKPVSAFFKGFFIGLKDGFAPVAGAIKKAFAPVMPVLSPVIGLVSKLWGWLKKLLAPVDDAGGAAKNMGAAFGFAVGKVVRMVLGVPFMIATLPLRFVALGRDMAAGLIKGMKAMFGKVKEAVGSLGSAIKDTFKSLLGIHSPSREFAGLGENLGQGLAMGMAGSAAVVKKAAAGLGTAAMLSVSLPAPAISLPAVDLPAAHLPGIEAPAVKPVSLPAGATGRSPVQGGGGGMHITFAPVINVGPGQARDVREQVERAARISFDEFSRLMRRYQAETGRRAFS